jgi:hypothetical protein
MMRIVKSVSRPIHIKLVWATCRVPFGLMPVTAKMPTMITARPSHPNQGISFSSPSAHEITSGRRSFSTLQSRHLLSYLWPISMFPLVPLWETAIMMPSPVNITTPITVHVMPMLDKTPNFPERSQNTTDEHDISISNAKQ